MFKNIVIKTFKVLKYLKTKIFNSDLIFFLPLQILSVLNLFFKFKWEVKIGSFSETKSWDGKNLAIIFLMALCPKHLLLVSTSQTSKTIFTETCKSSSSKTSQSTSWQRHVAGCNNIGQCSSPSQRSTQPDTILSRVHTLIPVRREFQGQRELIQGVPCADYCPHSVDLTATWLSSSDARGP